MAALTADDANDLGIDFAAFVAFYAPKLMPQTICIPVGKRCESTECASPTTILVASGYGVIAFRRGNMSYLGKLSSIRRWPNWL